MKGKEVILRHNKTGTEVTVLCERDDWWTEAREQLRKLQNLSPEQHEDWTRVRP
jgi:hypothetical protein